MGQEGHFDRLSCSSMPQNPALAEKGQETVLFSRHCLPEMTSQCAEGALCSEPATTQEWFVCGPACAWLSLATLPLAVWRARGGLQAGL